MSYRRILLLISAVLVLGVVGIHVAGGYICKASPVKMRPPPTDLLAQDVEFPSESGSVIHGWLTLYAVSPSVSTSSTETSAKPKGVVLLVAGIHGNRHNMVERAEFLHRAGYDALLIDLQGTGESPGRAVTFGWLESRDISAAVDFLHRERVGEPVAIIGQSLGGAATLLAAPPLRADAVVIESAFPTITDATRNRLVQRLGFLGRVLTPFLLADLQPQLGITPKDLRPIDHIAAIHCPLLVISGAEDRYTTADETKRLFAQATAPSRQLWLVPGAGHVNMYHVRPAEYESRILSFLNTSLASH